MHQTPVVMMPPSRSSSRGVVGMAPSGTMFYGYPIQVGGVALINKDRRRHSSRYLIGCSCSCYSLRRSSRNHRSEHPHRVGRTHWHHVVHSTQPQPQPQVIRVMMPDRAGVLRLLVDDIFTVTVNLLPITPPSQSFSVNS